MTPFFQELDFRPTPLGDLILRRRTMATLDNLEIYEIILGTEFLMSSLFTEVEEQLSKLGLAAAQKSFGKDQPLDIVIGGLGLGYTARAALDHDCVHSLLIVDYLKPVIEWHQQGIVPLGKGISEDPRCRLIHADFFKTARAASGETSFDPEAPDRKYHAILLDIDHTPEFLLHDSHGGFYQPDGLSHMLNKIHPGGIFAMWADGHPTDDFTNNLKQVFSDVETHVIDFPNPIHGTHSTGTVYLARC
ncbi:hypothetical protein Rhal01_00942 [Rubritalea halochordaticola]|uniref:Spermidine synthase n=1 Tax=Rubritalea halochordaticola TaxID=714537 RepID=A0ABP9UWF0_9BACT